MNAREYCIAEKYKEQGYSVLHNGAPDFLLLKHTEGEINKVLFVEVKRRGAQLTHEQKVWRDALKYLGAEFIVEVIE